MYRQDLGRKLPETLPVITFDGLSKQYSEFVAVRGLAFSVQRGEVFGFLGPNGAGKTTTIRMLMGVAPATSGEIFQVYADPAGHPFCLCRGPMPE